MNFNINSSSASFSNYNTANTAANPHSDLKPSEFLDLISASGDVFSKQNTTVAEPCLPRYSQQPNGLFIAVLLSILTRLNPQIGQLFTRLFDLISNRKLPIAPSLAGISENASLGTFKSVLKNSNFDNTIAQQESKGPVTIFAPTEAAFNKLDPKVKAALLLPENKATLDKILQYHVANKPVKFTDEPQNIDSLRENTVDQSVLTGTAEKPSIINGKQIITGQAAKTLPNGSVLIPVDDILIPPDVDLSKLVGLPVVDPVPPGDNATASKALKANTQLATLNALLDASQLTTALSDLEKSKPVTILAPTEEAFNKLDPKIKTALLKPENSEILKQILQYHVSGDAVSFNGQTKGFDSLLANNLDNNVLTGSETAPRVINGQQIVEGEKVLTTENKSIIVAINEVLIPPGLDLSKLV